MTKPLSRPALIVLALLIIGYTLFFTTQLFLHYYSFGSRSLDLGNMDQAIWNTLQGRPYHQTNQPGATNRLSLHVEPILMPVSLLYLIYSGPETLFVFQTIVVALGAIPVFALAHYKLKSEGLALLFALVYLLFPAIQGANLLDFHAVTLAPTFLLAAFYYLETRRPGRFALFAGLAVACKEDMTLLVLMMGLYALVINRQYRLGAVTIGLSLLWAFLAVFVIPPAFASTQNIHWNRYEHLGDSPAQMVLNMVLEPQRYLAHLQAVKALTYFRQLLAPTAYLALLNPITLLLAAPSFGINLLSNFPPMQRVNSLIYAAPTVPAVMISSIYGVANLRRWLAAVGNRYSVVSSQCSVISNQSSVIDDQVSVESDQLFDPNKTTPYAPRTTSCVLRPTSYNLLIALSILSASLIYHGNHGYLPGGGQFRGWEEVTDHHRRAARIFAQIPPEAALSAHDRLNPHVSQRETLYIFDRIEDADHIVLDITEDSWPLHPVALRDRVEQLLGDGFGIVDAVDGYLLLAKDRPDLADTLPDEFFDFARVGQAAPQYPTNIVFDDKLRLLGYDLRLGAHEAALPVITLYWQAVQPLEEDYAIWPFFIDRTGQMLEDTRQRPLVTTLWYPTSRWSPGEIIQTSTLPWDLGPEFSLAVGVAAHNWDDPGQRLPITEADEGLYTFENDTWVRLNTFQQLGRKRYQAVPQENVISPPAAPRAEFLDVITLLGAEVPAASVNGGEPLLFRLYWQSSNPISVDLTTFAHLLDRQGNPVAQLDWQPQDRLGYLPTSAWQPNRPIVDRQQLLLPQNLEAGEYRLVVGWYYAVTGERLPLTRSSEDGPAAAGNETVQIGLITVR